MKFAITRPNHRSDDTRTYYLAKKKQSFGNSMEFTPFQMDALIWSNRAIAEARAAKEGNGAYVISI